MICSNSQENFIDDEDKYHILKFVYSSVKLSNYRFKILKFVYDLKLLKQNTYKICPKYNGVNSLMVFKKINGKYFSVIIDRRTLKYNFEHLNILEIKMRNIKVRLNMRIYNGTIFDGTKLHNSDIFMINDVLMLGGELLVDKNITDKLIHGKQYFENYYKFDKILNTITPEFNKLHELSEIDKLANVDIINSPLKKHIKGITFMPFKFGDKLIFLYNNSTNENMLTTMLQPKQEENRTTYLENIKGIFGMSKTKIVDVYNLYLSKYRKEGDKKIIKYQKIGIAYLPTTESTKFCEKSFENENKIILVECMYSQKMKKWTPYQKITNKTYPDNMKYIEKKYNIKFDSI